MARLSPHQRKALEDLAKQIKPGITWRDPLGWCALPPMPPQTQRWLRRNNLAAVISINTRYTLIQGAAATGTLIANENSTRYRLTRLGACVLASDRKSYGPVRRSPEGEAG